MGRGRGSNHHGRTPDHRPHGRLARNRRRRRCRSHNLHVLPRLRHNPPWRWSHRDRDHRSTRLQRRLLCRCSLGHHCRRCRCGYCRWSARWCAARLLLPHLRSFDNGPRVPELRDVRKVNCRLGLHCRLARGAAAALPAEIGTYLFGLIGLDRTGVRLRLRDANRRQSIQNGSALDFQLSCKIVDSNFAHPSLFVSPAAFNCSYQPHRRLNLVQLNYYP